MSTQEFYITYDGIRLHAKLDRPDTDKCPLVIVFHGFTGHMEERHIIAVTEAINAAGMAALRVDMYGHGKSDGDFREHTILKWVTGALAVVEYVKRQDFVTDLYICGHSQGGFLVMLLAGMMPHDFKAILPLSPGWMVPEYARAGKYLGQTFDPERVPDEFRFGELCISGNYIRTAQLLNMEDSISRYNGPVLIVHGSADEMVPVEYARKAAKLYKNCTLAEIPDDTHCFDYHLEEVTAAVSRFLSSMQ